VSGYAHPREKSSCDVPPPFCLPQAALRNGAACSAEQRLTGQRPTLRQLGGETLGGMATSQTPVRISRHEDDAGAARPRQSLGDDLGRPGGKTSQSSFLPGSDHKRDRILVLDSRPSAPEREPASGALAATAYRPHSWRAAALTDRWRDSPQSGGAVLANLFAGTGTNEAALRQQQVEHERTRYGVSCGALVSAG
jgi:hypothetical protein